MYSIELVQFSDGKFGVAKMDQARKREHRFLCIEAYNTGKVTWHADTKTTVGKFCWWKCESEWFCRCQTTLEEAKRIVGEIRSLRSIKIIDF